MKAIPPNLKNALFIDPEAFLLTGLRSVLERQGCRVQVLKDASQAGDELRARRHDLVLAEMSLPKGAAYGLFRRMSQQKEPVVLLMMGRNPSRDQVLQSVRAGAADFLIKPMPTDSAMERIVRATKLTFGDPDGDGPDDGLSPRERVARGIKKAESTLALPHAVTKVIQLCNSSKSNAKDFAHPVESDPTVASGILKLANSTMFAKRGQTTKIQEAIVRIGFKNVRNMVLTLSVFKIIPREGGSATFNRLWYWQHSLAVGVLARMIAEQGRFVDKEDAFLTGLLHDIGKPILDDYAHFDFNRVIQDAAKNRRALHDLESEVFGVHHGQVGAVLLTKWGLPEEVGKAILRHHRYDLPQDSRPALPDKPDLGDVIWLANRLAKALFIGNSGDFLVEELPEDAASKFAIGALLADPELPAKGLRQMNEFFSALDMENMSASDLEPPVLDGGLARWKAPRRTILSIFLNACGFHDAKEDESASGKPELTILPADRAGESRGPVLALDGEETKDAPANRLPARSPYDILALHDRIAQIFAPARATSQAAAPEAAPVTPPPTPAQTPPASAK